jgi:hypothetical protein
MEWATGTAWEIAGAQATAMALETATVQVTETTIEPQREPRTGARTEETGVETA